MSNAPYWKHQPVHRETHREREERLDQLADREFAPASQRAIWNHADRLTQIDEAERIRARGYMTAIEHYQVSAALNGRTPEKARADAQAYFERTYTEAVAAERAAA